MTGEAVGLVAIVVTVAIAVTGWSLNAMREMRQKLNGMPQKVAQLDKECVYNENWRHDIAVPAFTDVKLLRLEMDHLKEKIDLKRDLDEIKRRLA